jgi:uncharacterized protein DUF5343
MDTTEAEKKPTVAYVPFKTFLSALDALKPGVPANINRSVWPTTSGVMVSQILGAFRFLGLINPDGQPTDLLHQLAENEADRKDIMCKLLTTRYFFAAPKALLKMDPNTLKSEMKDYGITGATLQKAITFFLQAARYADLPLSPYLMKKTRGPSARKKRNLSPRGLQEDIQQPKYVNPLTGGPAKTIKLSNGGSLTLQATVDTFQMTSEDRGFVLKLLDLIEDYEAQLKAQREP